MTLYSAFLSSFSAAIWSTIRSHHFPRCTSLSCIIPVSHHPHLRNPLSSKPIFILSFSWYCSIFFVFPAVPLFESSLRLFSISACRYDSKHWSWLLFFCSGFARVPHDTGFRPPTLSWVLSRLLLLIFCLLKPRFCRRSTSRSAVVHYSGKSHIFFLWLNP